MFQSQLNRPAAAGAPESGNQAGRAFREVRSCHWPLPETFEWKGRWIRNWFSNFEWHSRPIRLPYAEDIPILNVEAGFQGVKASDIAERRRIFRMEPAAAKTYGRHGIQSFREDWDYVSIAAMDMFCREKWQPGTPEAERLLKTPSPIIEFNNWGDTRWGACHRTGRGQNVVGLLITSYKVEIKKTGRLAPGAPEAHWRERQAVLVERLNRISLLLVPDGSSRPAARKQEPAAPRQASFFFQTDQDEGPAP